MTADRKIPGLFLEQLALNELPKEQKDALLNEFGNDDTLAAELESIKASNEEILEMYPARQMAASINEKLALSKQKKTRRAPIYAMVGTVMAAAAAVTLVLVLQNPSTITTTNTNEFSVVHSDSYTGLKGDPLLLVYKKGQEEIALENGAVTKEGDELQVKYHAEDARFGVIFSVDGRGAVTLHYPENPASSTALERKGSQVLSGAYKLDDAPLFERFFFVWSKTEEIDLDTVLEAGEKLDTNVETQLELPEKYQQKEVTLLKAQ